MAEYDDERVKGVIMNRPGRFIQLLMLLSAICTITNRLTNAGKVPGSVHHRALDAPYTLRVFRGLNVLFRRTPV